MFVNMHEVDIWNLYQCAKNEKYFFDTVKLRNNFRTIQKFINLANFIQLSVKASNIGIYSYLRMCEQDVRTYIKL